MAATRDYAVIIDQLRESGDLLQLFLNIRGFDARIASTGTQGIELAGSLRPIIVICDNSLPDMESSDVARSIRMLMPAYDPFLISLGGNTDFRTISNAITSGFDMYAEKPVNFDKLMHVFDRAARVRQANNASSN